MLLQPLPAPLSVAGAGHMLCQTGVDVGMATAAVLCQCPAPARARLWCCAPRAVRSRECLWSQGKGPWAAESCCGRTFDASAEAWGGLREQWCGVCPAGVLLGALLWLVCESWGCYPSGWMLFISLQPMKLEAGEELQLSIGFDPAYEEGLSARRVEQPLRIQFLEHPLEEQLLVRGEVFFPNLQFQSRAVDFGCILNNTEALHSLEMSNCSPLPVSYCWLLLPASQGSQLRYGHLCPLLEALLPAVLLLLCKDQGCFPGL